MGNKEIREVKRISRYKNKKDSRDSHANTWTLGAKPDPRSPSSSCPIPPGRPKARQLCTWDEQLGCSRPRPTLLLRLELNTIPAPQHPGSSVCPLRTAQVLTAHWTSCSRPAHSLRGGRRGTHPHFPLTQNTGTPFLKVAIHFLRDAY